jgi:hypothetical protein
MKSHKIANNPIATEARENVSTVNCRFPKLSLYQNFQSYMMGISQQSLICFVDVSAALYHGKNCSTLVGFKEQNNFHF